MQKLGEAVINFGVSNCTLSGAGLQRRCGWLGDAAPKIREAGGIEGALFAFAPIQRQYHRRLTCAVTHVKIARARGVTDFAAAARVPRACSTGACHSAHGS